MNNLNRPLIRLSYIRSLALGFVTLAAVLSAPAQAKNGLEEVLKSGELDQFPSSGSIEKSEAERIKAKMEELRLEMKSREEDLEGKKEQIEQLSGHTAISFLQALETNLSPELREQIRKASTPEEVAAINSPELTNIRNLMLQVKPMAAGLFKELDPYIQDSLDLSIFNSLQRARIALSKLQPNQQSSDLREIYRRMIYYKNIYLEFKKHYGTPDDPLRVTAHNKFSRESKDLFAALKSPGFTKTKRRARNLQKMLGMAAWAVQRPGLIVELAKTLKLVMENPNPYGQTNPIMRAVLELSRRMVKELGLPVKIEDEENLPDTTPIRIGNTEKFVKEVWIYAPSHRSMWDDSWAIAQLKNDALMPFASAAVYPRFISARLNTNMGFVPLGPKEHFTNGKVKALQIVETNPEMNSFLNYFGGRLPDMLGATTGAREQVFAEGGLIRTFENAGYKVHIVPISFRDNARLFGGRRLTRNDQLTIKVGPTLRAETREIISKLAGNDVMAILLRYGLIEDLVTNDELLWGQLRASLLDKALNEYLLNMDFEDDCEGNFEI